MSDFPGCLLIVTAEVDAAVETEWNQWYDTVHLPAALACPGVLRGTRYGAAGPTGVSDWGERSTEAAVRTYTTIYELAGPEAVDTPEFQAMRGWYEFTGQVRSRTQVLLRCGG